MHAPIRIRIIDTCLVRGAELREGSTIEADRETAADLLMAGRAVLAEGEIAKGLRITPLTVWIDREAKEPDRFVRPVPAPVPA